MSDLSKQEGGPSTGLQERRRTPDPTESALHSAEASDAGRVEQHWGQRTRNDAHSEVTALSFPGNAWFVIE